MSSWYKMEALRWNDGTDELTLEQEAAYLRIVNAIHIHNSPIRNDPSVLRGLFRCGLNKSRRIVRDLQNAGKIYIEDGRIHNQKAEEDLKKRDALVQIRSKIGQKGGLSSSETRRKPLKENEPGQAIASGEVEAIASAKLHENPPDSNQSDSETSPSSTSFRSVSGRIGGGNLEDSPHKALKSNGQGQAIASTRTEYNRGTEIGINSQNSSERIRPTPPLSDSEKKSDDALLFQELDDEVPGNAPKTLYSTEFTDMFWTRYPDRSGMSKKEAWTEWEKLKPTERQDASKALRNFTDLVRRQKQKRGAENYTTLHACRYLKQKRWESLTDGPQNEHLEEVRRRISLL